MSLRAKDVSLALDAAAALAALERATDKRLRSVARRARALRDALLADCLHGEVVKKDRIPRALVERHGIENLYVEDLPDFWRLLYTVKKDVDELHVVVLAVVDHREYDRLFGKRGR